MDKTECCLSDLSRSNVGPIYAWSKRSLYVIKFFCQWKFDRFIVIYGGTFFINRLCWWLGFGDFAIPKNNNP